VLELSSPKRRLRMTVARATALLGGEVAPVAQEGTRPGAVAAD